MELFLARHGETDWLSEFRYQGSSDTPLNEKGRRQTQCLVRALASYKPAIVYSSSLERARVAAEMLSKDAGIPHKMDKRISERHFGTWEGLTWAEIKKRFPDEVEPYRSGDPNFAPGAGESLIDVQTRWKSFLKHLLSAHRDERVALVSHGGYIRAALMDILKTPTTAFHLIQQDPGTLNILRGDERHMRIVLINSCAHLVENGVSWASSF